MPAIQTSLFSLDYDLALYGVPEGLETRGRLFDRVLPRRRLDDVIAVGIQLSARELERLQCSERPLVGIGPYRASSSAVSIDDTAIARMATEHLIALGHTDIAFVGGTTNAAAERFGNARRIDGYHEANRSAGLSARAHVAPAAPTMPSGYEALGDRRSRPTAIVGVCDETVIGAVIATRRLGIAVPTELSVVGIDDHEHTRCSR